MSRSATLLVMLFAMTTFAANSLLCRFALRGTSIDAATFTLVRIASGALVLWLLVSLRRGRPQGSWGSAAALFAYAAAFSFAYLTLPVGTGALLLFGSVQATMIIWGLAGGERLSQVQVAGFALAIVGLIVLVLPGVAAPPLFGSVLMLTAGIAWGVYSVRGKGSSDALAATAGNFMRAALPSAAIALIFIRTAHWDIQGVGLAVASGALASGLGYVAWYAVLPALGATRAAAVQLSVPVITAAASVPLLGERITGRLVGSAAAILGGVALVVMERWAAQRAAVSQSLPKL